MNIFGDFTWFKLSECGLKIFKNIKIMKNFGQTSKQWHCCEWTGIYVYLYF